MQSGERGEEVGSESQNPKKQITEDIFEVRTR